MREFSSLARTCRVRFGTKSFRAGENHARQQFAVFTGSPRLSAPVLTPAGRTQFRPHPGGQRAGELNKLLDELDDSSGDLNDMIADLGLAGGPGDSTKAGKRRGEIAADWTRLRQWQTAQNIAAALNEYAGLLRPLMAGTP